jgi:hypothetical protein
MSHTNAEIRCESDLEQRTDLVFCTAIRHNAHDITVGLAFDRGHPSPSPGAIATTSRIQCCRPLFAPPPSCKTDQLELVGVFDDCAVSAVNGSAPHCSVLACTVTDTLSMPSSSSASTPPVGCGNRLAAELSKSQVPTADQALSRLSSHMWRRSHVTHYRTQHLRRMELHLTAPSF